MAKGGYQRRRLQQKKAAERAARKRAARRRLIMTWLVGVVLLGLIGTVTLLATTGNDETDLATEPSAGPSASASPVPCRTPEPGDKGKKTFSAPPCPFIDASKTYTAVLDTTKGSITIELFAKVAPKTVSSFVFLARQGFYDGSPFHRVIPNFGENETAMIQGGDAVNRDGTGGPGYQFEDENTVPFDKPGYLAMANSGPGTNGSQFFILEGTVAHLNAPGQCPGAQGCHSVFGLVTEGMDIVDAIGSVPTEGDRPTSEVLLRKVTIREG